MTTASRPSQVGSFLSRSRHSARPSLEALEPRLAPASYTVMSVLDDGTTNTLRDCIAQAHLNHVANVGDTIAIPHDLYAMHGPIYLQSELLITDALTITSTGGQIAILRNAADPAVPQFRLFDITAAAGTVSLNGLDLHGGSSTGINFAGSGGGIFNAANLLVQDCYIHDNTGSGYGGGGISTTGKLTVINSLIEANSVFSGDGGGIYSNGALSLSIIGSAIEGNKSNSGVGGGLFGNTPVQISSSLFANNQATRGGGIYADGSPLVITDSLIEGNVAGSFGGGLYLNGGNTRVTGTTFDGNQAGAGGGVYVEVAGSAQVVTFTNSTFSGNRAGGNGGALATLTSYANLTVDFYDCTIANNTASGLSTGGVYAYKGTFGSSRFDYQGSLFAFNANGSIGGAGIQGVDYTLTSLGNNLSTDGIGMTAADVVTSTPGIDILRDNGGLTPTIALLPGSPALDAGVAINKVTTDQRGVSRPQGSAPDIGAFEALTYAYSPSGDGQTAFTDTPFPSPLGLTITQGGLGVSGTAVTFTVTSGVATFSNGLASITAFTDLSGNVSVPLTAGGIVGPVQVTATVGVKVVATYNETVAAAPKLVLDGSDEFIHVNETFTRTGSVTYPGSGATAYVDYGEGLERQPVSYDSDTGKFILSHAYLAEGSYQVTVTLFDSRFNQLDERIFDIDVLLDGERTDQADKASTTAGVVTAREPGVTATLTHLSPNEDKSDASIIVALVPIFVANGLNGSTQIGGNTITTAYDVRATKIRESDSVTIVFHYFNDDFDLPVLRYYDRQTKREEEVDSRLFVVDRFAKTITLVLDRSTQPRIQDIGGTVFTIAVPLAVNVPPAPVPLAPVTSPTLDPTAALSVQQVSQGSGGSGASGSSGEAGGSGGGSSNGIAFALAQVTGNSAVFAFATTTTLASLPDAPSSAGDKKSPLRDLPAVPDSLITLPGPILTPGSAEMSAPKEPSNTTTQPETTTPPPETTAPPSTSRLDSFFEETDVFVSESNALDEVFVQLSDGRLASCHDAWDEPQTDWRDMTLAVAAVLATRPVALRRRRSPAAPGER